MRLTVSVVRPEISNAEPGTVVELVFVVDETGVPGEIEVRSDSGDSSVVRNLVDAVAQWRFAPLLNAEGRPVARKVLLPVHIVDEVEDNRLFAAK